VKQSSTPSVVINVAPTEFVEILRAHAFVSPVFLSRVICSCGYERPAFVAAERSRLLWSEHLARDILGVEVD
jgi:hypothetical protein